MEKKQLVKLIDHIVKARIDKILKDDKMVKEYIKEEIRSQLISILLENKINLNINKQKEKKRYQGLTDLIDETDKQIYPSLQKQEQVSKQYIRYSKDQVLNKLLNETPYINDDYGGGVSGNALMDMGSFSDESINYAQNYAQSIGKNVKIDIDPNALDKVKNTIPNNSQFIIDKKTPQLKEYKGSDGLLYVDDRELFANEEITPQQLNQERSFQAIENALNKDYRGLLANWDSKIKQKRKQYL